MFLVIVNIQTCFLVGVDVYRSNKIGSLAMPKVEFYAQLIGASLQAPAMYIPV